MIGLLGLQLALTAGVTSPRDSMSPAVLTHYSNFQISYRVSVVLQFKTAAAARSANFAISAKTF